MFGAVVVILCLIYMVVEPTRLKFHTKGTDDITKIDITYNFFKKRQYEIADSTYKIEIAKGILDNKLELLAKAHGGVNAIKETDKTKYWHRFESSSNKMEEQLDALYDVSFEIYKLLHFLKKEITYCSYIKEVDSSHSGLILNEINKSLKVITVLESVCTNLLRERKYIC